MHCFLCQLRGRSFHPFDQNYTDSKIIYYRKGNMHRLIIFLCPRRWLLINLFSLFAHKIYCMRFQFIHEKRDPWPESARANWGSERWALGKAALNKQNSTRKERKSDRRRGPTIYTQSIEFMMIESGEMDSLLFLRLSGSRCLAPVAKVKQWHAMVVKCLTINCDHDNQINISMPLGHIVINIFFLHRKKE